MSVPDAINNDFDKLSELCDALANWMMRKVMGRPKIENHLFDVRVNKWGFC